MKRSPCGLETIAHWHNLAAAFHRAARGKRNRWQVRLFAADLFGQLSRLQKEILEGVVSLGRMRAFSIHDPKPRLIHAPCFRERVLHHALMAHAGPVLDRVLVDDTYACRVGKGTLAAVRRAQHHGRRHPWWVKIDMQAYFASVDHGILLELLSRRFKDRGLLDIIGRIVNAYHTDPGRGLPIGALTSQHFANYYLNGLDRFLLEDCKVKGLVRYMDDLVWWVDDKDTARKSRDEAVRYAKERLRLTVKQPTHLGRSRDGLLFCGYRILPGRLLLSRRRKRRYTQLRRQWEQAWSAGEIGALDLQAGFAAAHAITVHADAAAWRAAQLLHNPLEPELLEL